MSSTMMCKLHAWCSASALFVLALLGVLALDRVASAQGCPASYYACSDGSGCCQNGLTCGTGFNDCEPDKCCDLSSPPPPSNLCPSGSTLCRVGDAACCPNDTFCGENSNGCAVGSCCRASASEYGANGDCPSGSFACDDDACCPTGTFCGTGINGCARDSCCMQGPGGTAGSGGGTAGTSGSSSCPSGTHMCEGRNACCPDGTVCGSAINGCDVGSCCSDGSGTSTTTSGDFVCSTETATGCSLQFCVDLDACEAYYSARGRRFECPSCSSLNSCAQSAAQHCAGASSTSSGGSSSGGSCCSAGDPCDWAGDGTCDCDGTYGWDSDDCEDGCSVRAAGGRSGRGGVTIMWLATLALALLRRHSRKHV